MVLWGLFRRPKILCARMTRTSSQHSVTMPNIKAKGSPEAKQRCDGRGRTGVHLTPLSPDMRYHIRMHGAHARSQSFDRDLAYAIERHKRELRVASVLQSDPRLAFLAGGPVDPQSWGQGRIAPAQPAGGAARQGISNPSSINNTARSVYASILPNITSDPMSWDGCEQPPFKVPKDRSASNSQAAAPSSDDDEQLPQRARLVPRDEPSSPIQTPRSVPEEAPKILPELHRLLRSQSDSGGTLRHSKRSELARAAMVFDGEQQDLLDEARRTISALEQSPGDPRIDLRRFEALSSLARHRCKHRRVHASLRTCTHEFLDAHDCTPNKPASP